MESIMRCAYVFMLLMLGVSGQAQPQASVGDEWVKGFAAGASEGERGRENQLNGDSRFSLLLLRSFHQHQYFWRDHGVFTPVPDLVQEFIGVPGDVALSEDRYVTANGCVPHSCSLRGMVWIDTGARDPTVLFVANSNVSTSSTETGSLVHLWIFSSTKLNGRNLPPAFKASMSEWWKTSTKQWEKYSIEKVVVVTIVQPTGELVDLSPAVVGL